MVRTSTVVTGFDDSGVPEIERLEYDLWRLRISVRFQPGDPPVYVTFSEPSAFRVMDERNLNEFWADGARSSSWLWIVLGGGWIDDEEQRSGFIREMTPGVEYLVLGRNDCVTVIASSPPTVVSARS